MFLQYGSNIFIQSYSFENFTIFQLHFSLTKAPIVTFQQTILIFILFSLFEKNLNFLFFSLYQIENNPSRMKNLSEMFEFLKNCENETILKELKNHCQKLNHDHAENASIKFKLDIEKISTLQRFSEWCLIEEFKSIGTEEKPTMDDIMTVEETAKYLKTTTQTIYTLVNKGKLNKCEISTVDKPGARPIIRIRKSDINDYLNGK